MIRASGGGLRSAVTILPGQLVASVLRGYFRCVSERIAVTGRQGFAGEFGSVLSSGGILYMRKSLSRVGVVVLTLAGVGVLSVAGATVSIPAVTGGVAVVTVASAQDPIWGGVSVESDAVTDPQDPIWG
jgi:hypothetical protein